MPADPMPSWFQFLRVEADLVMTFIALAGRKPERSSSLGNARKALAQIQHCLMDPPAYGLNEDETAFLEQRCTEGELALRTFESEKHGCEE
jgi:hypothetical protein